VWALPACARYHTLIQAMASKFDQGVRIALVTATPIAGAGPASQRVERGPKRGSADGIEEPLQEERSALTGAQLKAPVRDVLALLRQIRRGVGGMSDVRAVVPKSLQPVGESLVDEGCSSNPVDWGDSRIARAVPARTARCANPSFPPSTAATLRGRSDTWSPTEIAFPVAAAVIPHSCRIHWIGLT
jgi:hypothetical protein